MFNIQNNLICPSAVIRIPIKYSYFRAQPSFYTHHTSSHPLASKACMYFLTPRAPPPALEHQQTSVVTNVPSHRKPRRLFTTEEDRKLIQLVEQFGVNAWTVISDRIPGRTSRQCKERYFTYLSPGVKKAPWTDEEDSLLFQKFQELGPRWSDIARYFDGRTANSIKNRWHLHLRGRYSKQRHQRMHFPEAPPPLPCYVVPVPCPISHSVPPRQYVAPVACPPQPVVLPNRGGPKTRSERPKLEFPPLTQFPFPPANV